jgi:hypothetical protein
MEPLMAVAGVVFTLSFILIVRFSHSRYKYHALQSEKASVSMWKTFGIRTRYYQLAVMMSGLITMAIVVIFKLFI